MGWYGFSYEKTEFKEGEELIRDGACYLFAMTNNFICHVITGCKLHSRCKC